MWFGLGLLLILIVTNPSPNQFREYSGWRQYHSVHRRWNLFVCSIYEGDWDKSYRPIYIGVLGNFFIVNWEPLQP